MYIATVNMITMNSSEIGGGGWQNVLTEEIIQFTIKVFCLFLQCLGKKEKSIIHPMWKMGGERFAHSNQCGEDSKTGLERLIKASLTASLRINGYTNLIYNKDPFLNLAEMPLCQSVTAVRAVQIFQSRSPQLGDKIVHLQL